MAEYRQLLAYQLSWPGPTEAYTQTIWRTEQDCRKWTVKTSSQVAFGFHSSLQIMLDELTKDMYCDIFQGIY
jgi:hypothetical protein